MTQVLAMFLDGYRELNSKKLFWITLVISGMVVLVYASIGFDETGMSMFFGFNHVESEYITKGSPIARMLYRSIFSSFIVGLWLAWIAIILAIISTTTIFPDFVAGGAIDLILSKPIGRVKLFLIKYCASLLFVLLQVGLFCAGVFICMGWRIGEWNWTIFAAVPLLVLLFSYLYCVNVLVGIVTRSALTALLVTMLFWFSLFSLNMAEGIVNQFHTQFTVASERAQEDIDRQRDRLELIEDTEENAPARARIESDISQRETDREDAERIFGKLDPWRSSLRLFQVIVPKTNETVGLLDRWLKEDTDVNLLDIMSGNIATDESGNFVPETNNEEREVVMRLQAEVEARSLWYVLGTSVIFNVVVLAGACWVFVRRDF